MASVAGKLIEVIHLTVTNSWVFGEKFGSFSLCILEHPSDRVSIWFQKTQWSNLYVEKSLTRIVELNLTFFVFLTVIR